MASDVASSVGEQVYNGGKRQSVSDVSVCFSNVLKVRRRTSGASNTDASTASGCAVSTEKSSSNPFLLRRRSTLKEVAQGITGLLRIRRLTKGKVESIKTKIEQENTYKMSPDAGEHVAVSKIEQMAEGVLRDEIGTKEYNSYTAGYLACSISAKIKTNVKEMNFPRYRIVCQVVITEVKDQGLEAASRSLWDASTDNFTTVTYTNDSIAAVALIYGVYFE